MTIAFYVLIGLFFCIIYLAIDSFFSKKKKEAAQAKALEQFKNTLSQVDLTPYVVPIINNYLGMKDIPDDLDQKE